MRRHRSAADCAQHKRSELIARVDAVACDGRGIVGQRGGEIEITGGRTFLQVVRLRQSQLGAEFHRVIAAQPRQRIEQLPDRATAFADCAGIEAGSSHCWGAATHRAARWMAGPIVTAGSDRRWPP